MTGAASPHARAVDRFAAWLTDFSPYYRALRTEVPVADDAPARLAHFWRTVGWAPGIGLSWWYDGFPPVREFGRAEADKAFRRWLGQPCFTPAMRLTEPTRKALWDQLPRRCWVLRIEEPGSCHGGLLLYVDEDAGDDPPLMIWDTRHDDHDSGPTHPRERSASCLTELMESTLVTIAGRTWPQVQLEAPAQPGPFAPVIPHFWQLGDGVWGVVDTDRGTRHVPTRAEARTVPGRVIYRSARTYLEYLIGLAPQLLPDYQGKIRGTQPITVEESPALSAPRLVEQGFSCAQTATGWIAAGRLDGMPLVVDHYPASRSFPAHEILYVLPEDSSAVRARLKQDRIRVLVTGWLERLRWSAEPDATLCTRTAKLVQRAEQAAGRGSGGSEPKRARPAEPVAAADPAEEAAVRAEAADLRRWLLATDPGLELTPPELAPDEPPLVRAFWAELGYSEDLVDVLGWPDRDSSVEKMRELLAEYRRLRFKLRRKALPKRFRLAWLDNQDYALLLTDEDSAADDPPVLGVDPEDGEIEPVYPSYLTMIGEQVALHAGTHQAHWLVRTDPPLDALGTQPYPRLAPRTRQLTAEVRALPEGGSATISAPRVEDLIGWLAGTTMVHRLELSSVLSGGSHGAAELVLDRFAAPPALRCWQAPDGDARCCAGSVDGVPIMVTTTNRPRLYSAYADRERARALAAAAGWL